MWTVLYFNGFFVLFYLYFLVLKEIKRKKGSDNNKGILLFCLIHYCGLYVFLGSELVNIWSAGHSLVAVVMLFISPIVMLIFGVQRLMKPIVTSGHKIVSSLCFGYIIILGLLLLFS